MPDPQTSLFGRVTSHHDGLRVLAILVAVLAALAVLTVVFGVTHPGPGYDSFPDPAGALPF